MSTYSLIFVFLKVGNSELLQNHFSEMSPNPLELTKLILKQFKYFPTFLSILLVCLLFSHFIFWKTYCQQKWKLFFIYFKFILVGEEEKTFHVSWEEGMT